MKLTFLVTISMLMAVTITVIAQTANQAASAQKQQSPESQLSPSNNAPIVQAKSGPMSLNFRLPKWKTLHMHDEAKAKEAIDTLQSIGCEVTKNPHNGHIDVRYRCLSWKPLKLDTVQQLQEWQSWLSEKGIDSVVLNPSPQSDLPTVRYRLVAGRSAHIHNADHVRELYDTFKMLGCEVSKHAHNGHTDISVKCVKWTTVGLTSEKSAHIWQDWLDKNGFETQHTHKK